MTAIEFENISKQYRLGLVSTKTLAHDLNRFWQTRILGHEDPYLKIGETNDRSSRGSSEYVWALRDINFKVEQGDVVGIIGKNGAGKSTLLKLLSQVTGPTTGTIKARGRIGSLLEVGTGFHQEMTGRENIFLNGAILGMTRAEVQRKLDEIVDFSGCERYIDTPVKRYSSGMMVRLGFAVAAHLDPEILVVDEVLAVGDAEFQKKAIGKMQDVSKGEGRTVLFVSHNMASIKALCNNGIVLKNGEIDFTGTAEACINHYISRNNTTLKNASKGNELIRLFDTVKELEILQVRFLNESLHIASNETLLFELNIKKNTDVKNMSVEVMIDNQKEERVGGYISQIFDITNFDNSFTVTIHLKNHNLAKGYYTVNFNIGLKDIEVGLKDYDVVYQAVSFVVDKSNQQSQSPIVLWREGWGNCCFQDAEVYFNNK